MARNNKQTDDPKPMIPLEYCSPERAARLLGCEVEDIFHWAAVGSITLYAQFHDGQFSGGERHKVGEIYISNNLITYDEYEDDEYSIDESSHIKPPSNKQIGPIYANENSLRSDSRAFKFGAGICLFEPEDGFKDRMVDIYGIWAIERSCFILEQSLDAINAKSLWYLTSLYIGEEDLLDFNLGIDLSDAEISDMPSRIRVMHEDLLKIRHHILTGELMPKNASVRPENRDRTSTVTDAPHPTAELKAINRERVLAAAIRARELWPDDCKTATAWADTLVNFSMQLFDTPEPPYSQEHIARLLGRAMNDGQPYRKS